MEIIGKWIQTAEDVEHSVTAVRLHTTAVIKLLQLKCQACLPQPDSKGTVTRAGGERTHNLVSSQNFAVKSYGVLTLCQVQLLQLWLVVISCYSAK